MSRVIDEHRQYLSDETRIASFTQAIGEAVRRGDVVLDLGAGTGILGLLACRAGASRVYSIESDSIIEIARSIARANGYEDRIVFIKGISTRVELPEQVDVIVGDQIGRMGFEAGLLDYLSDARERFLKPGGRIIPASVDLMIAPVESWEMRERIDFWDHSPIGFEWGPARRIASNTGYPVSYHPNNLLGQEVVLTTFETAVATNTPFGAVVTLEISRAGTLHGIGAWFFARMSESATMTNSPLAEKRINRRNVFLPIEQPVAVEPGDIIRLQMRIRPQDLIVTWNVKVWRGITEEGGKLLGQFAHSTFKGMLIAQETIQRTQPGFVPRLTPWGEARLSILSLCDGRRTLTEIEREVYHRHPQLFRSESEAAGFVAEVIPGYSL